MFLGLSEWSILPTPFKKMLEPRLREVEPPPQLHLSVPVTKLHWLHSGVKTDIGWSNSHSHTQRTGTSDPPSHLDFSQTQLFQTHPSQLLTEQHRRFLGIGREKNHFKTARSLSPTVCPTFPVSNCSQRLDFASRQESSGFSTCEWSKDEMVHPSKNGDKG